MNFTTKIFQINHENKDIDMCLIYSMDYLKQNPKNHMNLPFDLKKVIAVHVSPTSYFLIRCGSD